MKLLRKLLKSSAKSNDILKFYSPTVNPSAFPLIGCIFFVISLLLIKLANLESSQTGATLAEILLALLYIGVYS